jgi:hypothetical protein
MNVRQRAVRSMAWIVAACATSAATTVSAQDYAGLYRIVSDVTTAEVPEWGTDCGRRPENQRGSTGRTVRVSADGTNLVIEDRPRMRTDGCWSQNPRVRRVSFSGGNGRWSTQCSSPDEDYQHEEGTYTSTIEGDRLTLRERTLYRWTLNSSVCRATLTRTIVYERIDIAPTPVQDSGAAVTPPVRDSGERPVRCAVPGPAARIAIVAGRRSTTPGSRVCFRAQLVDADGCPAINAGGAVITWSVTRRGGGDAPPGEGGCITIAPSIAAGTEFLVTATSTTGLEERVTLRVVTPEESRSLVAQIIEDEDAGTLVEDASAPRIDEGFGSVAPAVTHGTAAASRARHALVATLTAAAVLLTGIAFFLLRTKKPTKREKPEPSPSDACKGEPSVVVQSAAGATTSSDVGRSSIPGQPPRVRKDEVAIPLREMPIGGLLPMAAQAKKSAPSALAQTMIGAMPVGTDGVIAEGVAKARAQSSMAVVHPPASSSAPSASDFHAPAAPAKSKRCPVCHQRFGAENAFCPEHGVSLVDADALAQPKVVIDPRAAVPSIPAPPTLGNNDPLEQTRIAASTATATVPLRCPVCGRTYGAGNIFCGEDGTRLVSV